MSDGEEAELEQQVAVPLSVSPTEGRARPFRISRVEELDEIAPYASDTEEQEQQEEQEEERSSERSGASEHLPRPTTPPSSPSESSATGFSDSRVPSARSRRDEEAVAAAAQSPFSTAIASSSGSAQVLEREQEPQRRDREGPQDTRAKNEFAMREPPVAFDAGDLLKAHTAYASGSHKDRGAGRKGGGDRKEARGLDKMFTSVYLPSESASGFGADARRKWYNSCELLWMDED